MEDMTLKEKLEDIGHRALDRIRKEPILLWAVLYTAWEWQYPDATPAAVAVIIAIGALFQRSLVTPESEADMREWSALSLGALKKESEVNAFLSQVEREEPLLPPDESGA